MNQAVLEPETFTISLDSLLAESMAAKAESDKEKELRKRLNSGRLTSPEETIETKKLLKQWDNKREWKRTTNIAVFTRQKCTCCGAFSHTFEGYFEGYANTRMIGATKVEAVKFFELDLPKEVKYHDALVPVCHECADMNGWELEGD